MKFGVIVFPGSNCDRDVVWVTQGLLNQPTRMIWHEETDISDLDVVVIPGGFSYGDYLRCGAIARFSPVMKATVEHAKLGKPVLGICNGFQVLTEAGLLPGALARNAGLNFICDRTPLKVESTNSLWTSAYKSGQIINLPIAHGEGRYYADADTLAELEDNGQILFRYCTSAGKISNAGNPNGSLNNIAGICNRQGNVLGMMPHPERASDPILGKTDGIKLFEGLLLAAVAD
ncbi:phosphoribosylformylglycinamidine synthase subunit PurQ [Kamptonema sp. UHCC 0994]|uniref:phosphoribosylformylglycinamidine synthase subunit PurQ n=1 Tax=Kamptonema sp. UHCC 0994 TaxID=3031329 RepID=UPI0023B9A795|nr:phosphoribosylformylglycinamidine synthase subunit PurQ [Kamptonema sp. UHCC 0994]MDF0551704.1 phosphoribosylformylglycinamidine synthase subunit PurQ [Kamptonema sp. UHCC 0994]